MVLDVEEPWSSGDADLELISDWRDSARATRVAPVPTEAGTDRGIERDRTARHAQNHPVDPLLSVVTPGHLHGRGVRPVDVGFSRHSGPAPGPHMPHAEPPGLRNLMCRYRRHLCQSGPAQLRRWAAAHGGSRYGTRPDPNGAALPSQTWPQLVNGFVNATPRRWPSPDHPDPTRRRVAPKEVRVNRVADSPRGWETVVLPTTLSVDGDLALGDVAVCVQWCRDSGPTFRPDHPATRSWTTWGATRTLWTDTSGPGWSACGYTVLWPAYASEAATRAAETRRLCQQETVGALAKSFGQAAAAVDGEKLFRGRRWSVSKLGADRPATNAAKGSRFSSDIAPSKARRTRRWARARPAITCFFWARSERVASRAPASDKASCSTPA